MTSGVKGTMAMLGQDRKTVVCAQKGANRKVARRGREFQEATSGAPGTFKRPEGRHSLAEGILLSLKVLPRNLDLIS